MQLQAKMMVLLCLCAGVLFCQNNHSIQFKVERDKTILPVKIGGSGTLKIILDSGMGYDGLLIYNPDLRDSIRLNSAMNYSLGGAGNGNGQQALVDTSASFSIGGLEFKNQRIIILQGNSFKGFPSDGVTGYSILGHYTVEMNYDNNTMTLYNPDTFEADNSWSKVPIYFKNNNIPWIDISVSVAGEVPVPLSVYIDYASSEAVELLERKGQKFKSPVNMKEVYIGTGLSGKIYGKRGLVKSVSIGPYILNNVKVVFTPAEVRSRQDKADAVVANSLLRRFNIVLDYKNKLLYLKPNTHFSEKF